MKDEEKPADAAQEREEPTVEARRLRFFYDRVSKLYREIPRVIDKKLPDYFNNRASEFIHDGFYSLCRYLESPEEPEVSWEDPVLELQYPVPLDWKLWETSRDVAVSLLYRGLDHGDVIEEARRDPEAFAHRITGNYLEWADYLLLSRMTHEVGYVKRGEDYEPHLPAEEQKRLDELPEEEAFARLDELFEPFSMGFLDVYEEDLDEEGNVVPERVEARLRGREPFGPAAKVSGDVDGKPFTADALLAVYPLVVNEDEHRAYFPVVVGLAFDGEGGDPTTWSEADRRQFWEELLESLREQIGAPPRPKQGGETKAETGARAATGTFPDPVAVKPGSRYLLEGASRIDKRAAELVAHVENLTLPRKWSAVRKWDELVQEEIERLELEHGEEAFEDLRKKTRDENARGPLLRRRYKPGGEELVTLAPEAEEALLASVGHKGFRRVQKDEDGASREYLVKRFKAGTGYLEARLSWYGMAWPLVDEGREKAKEDLEALRDRLRQGNLFEDLDEKTRAGLDSRLRLLESVRDARHVMDLVLHRFGRDGENPLHLPAWELRTLLECENDTDGFRRVRGCLRALQEVRFALEARGTGAGTARRVFGPFLGEVSYVPRGPGEHTDGDFYLNIQPHFLGCLRVFGTAHYKLRDARKILAFDWGKDLSKEERKELEEGFVKGFSALAPYYDRAKGFTPAQRRLRAWIERSITLRKDYASKSMKAAKVKPAAADADEPRLYGRNFCPLLPPEALFHGALGHFKKNPESGRTLYGTSTAPTRTGGAHAAGLLAEMGLYLNRGAAKAQRAETVRKALEAFRAVVEEAYGGTVAARHGGKWLSLEEASKLPEEELGKRTSWCFFLPRDWSEKRAADLEAYHAERHARGEVPYIVKVTKDRDVAAKAHEDLAGERRGGDVGLGSEPLRIRLYAARKDRKLSQADVGELFGVSQRTVGLWEAGPDLDEKGRPKGKPIPAELVPLLLRWVETEEAPTAEELASRKTRRAGVQKEEGS